MSGGGGGGLGIVGFLLGVPFPGLDCFLVTPFLGVFFKDFWLFGLAVITTTLVANVGVLVVKGLIGGKIGLLTVIAEVGAVGAFISA